MYFLYNTIDRIGSYIDFQHFIYPTLSEMVSKSPFTSLSPLIYYCIEKDLDLYKLYNYL